MTPSVAEDAGLDRFLRLTFRALSYIEALTWAGLLFGMLLKYVISDNESVVQLFGPIHGATWVALLVSIVVTGNNFRWPGRAIFAGLALSILPFLSVAFDLWIERANRLQHQVPNRTT